MEKNYILKDGVLYHYGTKGQKWGNRRYQYEDGSLTPEGKIRYSDSGKPRNRPKHINTNANVSSVNKKETVDVGGSVGKGSNALSSTLSKPRNRPKHINTNAKVSSINKKDAVDVGGSVRNHSNTTRGTVYTNSGGTPHFIYEDTITEDVVTEDVVTEDKIGQTYTYENIYTGQQVTLTFLSQEELEEQKNKKKKSYLDRIKDLGEKAFNKAKNYVTSLLESIF
jgi:hypothetical protein